MCATHLMKGVKVMALNMAMDFDNLKNIGTGVIAQATEFQTEVKNIYNIVDSIATGPEWEGEDTEKFVNTVNGYRPDMDNLGKVIHNYGDFLVKASAAMQATNQDIAAAAGKL